MNISKISVILPVYKVEKYIKKCLDSLINQTLVEIEIILIDDCGGDNSIKIAEDYAKKDDRITIIYNEKNIGTGFSRNAGIKIAKGEYIGFVDPDDWIDLDYYEKLYQKAKEDNSNIVKTTCIKIHVDENNRKEIRNELNLNIGKGLKKDIPLFSLFTYEHTTAIYKKSIIIENNIGYPNIRNGQDCVFLFYVTYYAKTISLIDSVYYYYQFHSSSIVHKTDKKRLLSRLEQVGLLLDFLNSKEMKKSHYLYAYRKNIGKFYQKDISSIFDKRKEHIDFKSEYLRKSLKLTKNFKYIDEKKINSVLEVLVRKKNNNESTNIIKKIMKFFIKGKLKRLLKKVTTI